MSNGMDDDDDVIKHLKASGLKPIVIDENTDFSKLDGLIARFRAEQESDKTKLGEQIQKAQRAWEDEAFGEFVDDKVKRHEQTAMEIRQTEEAMETKRRAMNDGFMHKEAFCLMWYACVRRPGENPSIRGGRPSGCGHMERIWNSRDGVTPFACRCPSCGGEMQHAFFGSDERAVGHVPHEGQKIWISLSKTAATNYARRRVRYIKDHQPEYYQPKMEKDEYIEEVARHIWNDGEAPELFVLSYGETWEEVKNLLDAR